MNELTKVFVEQPLALPGSANKYNLEGINIKYAETTTSNMMSFRYKCLLYLNYKKRKKIVKH